MKSDLNTNQKKTNFTELSNLQMKFQMDFNATIYRLLQGHVDTECRRYAHLAEESYLFT